MITKHHSALVERPVACSGKGQYIALVYYGSRGGGMHHRVFKYSHKDPRLMGDAVVLRGITDVVPKRYRDYIVAISVIKRCLHPKSPQVAKVDRKPHVERVFSWVVEHDGSVRQAPEQAQRDHLEEIMIGNTVQRVMLPYTSEELRELPVKQVVTTNYWNSAFAAISLRGVERRVSLQMLTA